MSGKKFSLNDKILELAELKNKGRLTDQDFDEAKATILRALDSPQAEFRDMTKPFSMSMVIAWESLDPVTKSGGVEVTVNYRYEFDATSEFHVTTSVGDHTVGKPLLRFLEEVGSLSGDWNGTREYVNHDYHYGSQNFGVTCFWCHEGKIGMEVFLDADVIEPAWTIKLRMDVDQSAWPGIVKQFRDFFAVAATWE